MGGLTFRVLGSFRVDRDGVPVDLGGRLPTTLVHLLVAAEGRTVPIGWLVDQMWEEPPARAESSLAVYVSRLRRRLGDAAGGSRIQRVGAGYALVPDPADVLDVVAFRGDLAAAHEARTTGRLGDALAAVGDALDRWHDDLPPEHALPPGLRPDRLRLVEERAAALELDLDLRLALGRHAEVVARAEALAPSFPSHEAIGRLHALALYRGGRQPEALAVLRRLADRLDQEYGLEPTRALRELEHALLTQDPSLDAVVPIEPVATAAVASTGRESGSSRRPPVALTPILGRDGTLATLSDLLAGGTRLITLTGAGGAGKTRVALELGARLARDHDVAWVPLAELVDAARVEGAVAVGLGASLGVSDVREVLLRTVDDREVTVVIDNAEHVAAACARTVAALLAEAPGVRFLVTSRTPLSLPGERVVAVEPLDAGREGQPGPAVDLFLERASAVAPGWVPDAADLRAAGALCERLDGLPLAIELAAVRAGDLSPEEMLKGIDAWPELLAAPGRPTPHHRSLTTALGWSYDLLDERAQRVFRGLAVFDGGFDLVSANAVLDDDVVDVVATLAAHSLLVVDRSARPRRYRILHVLREWLVERTTPAEAAGHRDGLLQWATDLARAAGPFMRDFDDAPVWFRRLDQEMPNLRAALAHGLDGGSALLAMRFMTDVADVWIRGEHSAAEATELLQRAIDRAIETSSPSDRELGLAYTQLTEVCFTSAQIELGLTSGRAAQVYATAAGDLPTLAAATGETAYMLVWTGDIVAAEASARRAVELATDLPDDIRTPAAETMAWVACAIVEAARDDLEAAVPHLDRARESWERSNDWQATIGGMYFVERIALQLGETERIVAACAGAALRCAELEAGPLMAAHLLVLACALGDDDRAPLLLAGAMAHARRVGFEVVFVDAMFASDAVQRVQRTAGPAAWAAAVAATRDWDRAALLALVEEVAGGAVSHPFATMDG